MHHTKAMKLKHMHKIKEVWIEFKRHEILTSRFELFVDIYREWFINQDDKALLPLPSELLWRNEIISIVDQPNDIELGRQDFEPFRAKLPEWTLEWRTARDDELRALVRNSPQYAGLPSPVDPLTLASVAFDCKTCARYESTAPMLPPLPPYSAMHRCLTPFVKVWGTSGPLERAVRAACGDFDEDENMWERCGYASWTAKSLRIGVWHRRVCEVIRAAGKDPMSTTREDMDGLEDLAHMVFGARWVYMRRRWRSHPPDSYEEVVRKDDSQKLHQCWIDRRGARDHCPCSIQAESCGYLLRPYPIVERMLVCGFARCRVLQIGQFRIDDMPGERAFNTTLFNRLRFDRAAKAIVQSRNGDKDSWT